MGGKGGRRECRGGGWSRGGGGMCVVGEALEGVAGGVFAGKVVNVVAR